MEAPPFYRIVLTGGPCGGKSTALSSIAERMQGLGLAVFRIPETATLLLGGGVSVRGLSAAGLVAIQEGVLRVMMGMEDVFCTLARSAGRPAVVLCDRGTMDVSAYLPRDAWTALLDEHDWTVVGLRDRRYEAVIHLVTAADGAEGFCTTENNAVRTETPAQARALDQAVRDARVGHPHLHVIDNSTDFAHKVQRVLAAVCRVAGVPEPLEVERRFLVRGRAGQEMPVHFEEFDVEQTSLLGPKGGRHGCGAAASTARRPARTRSNVPPRKGSG